MISCATLLESHPNPSTKHLDTQKLACLLAAVAALNVSFWGSPMQCRQVRRRPDHLAWIVLLGITCPTPSVR
jgi:hypothetical protein